MLIGLESAVHVYSTSTSRLVHALRIGTSHTVVGHRICPINRNHLYVFASSGQITKWEWTVGKRVCKWDTGCRTIVADLASDGTDAGVSFFCLQEEKDQKRRISIRRPVDDGLLHIDILDTPKKITGLRIAHRGQVAVAWAGDHVLTGMKQCIDNPIDVSESVQYTWTDFKSPVDITCADIREGMPQNSKWNPVDIVLGGSGGSVLVLYDALNCMFNSKEGPAFRRLHWHRGAVSAVCWSMDGTYAKRKQKKRKR